MNDERKTKSQLIEELSRLRQRIVQLEKLGMQYKRDEEKLRTTAFIDELTGIYNRKGLLALGEKQINMGNRTKQNVLVLFLDLDSLKAVNDSFGHATGDRALVDFANILKRTFRESDIVSRWGGDEFAVVALANENQNADVLVNRLQQAIKSHNSHQGRPFYLSCSVGIATYDPRSPCDINGLLQAADEAMYQKKRTV
jgi:two-component system cell cycle response regulator